MDLEEKIKGLKDGAESNCHGTSLYLIGVLDTEYPIESEYIRTLKKVEIPKAGDIIAFTLENTGWIIHSAYIVNENPLTLVHRGVFRGNIKTETLDEVRKDLIYKNSNLEYYRKK